MNISLTKRIDDNEYDSAFNFGESLGNSPKLYDVMLKINEDYPNSNFNSTIANNTIESLGGKVESDDMSWFVYEKKDKEEIVLNKGK